MDEIAGNGMTHVIAFGVFDLLHPGHLAFLKQARRLGDELVVVVARDDVAEREKGRRPRLTVRERMQLVVGVRWVDRAVIGDPPDRYFSMLRRLKPDIIALGYDQSCDVAAFRHTLTTLGLPKTRVVRLRKYADGRHHSRELVRHQ